VQSRIDDRPHFVRSGQPLDADLTCFGINRDFGDLGDVARRGGATTARLVVTDGSAASGVPTSSGLIHRVGFLINQSEQWVLRLNSEPYSSDDLQQASLSHDVLLQSHQITQMRWALAASSSGPRLWSGHRAIGYLADGCWSASPAMCRSRQFVTHLVTAPFSHADRQVGRNSVSYAERYRFQE
jgi:hypothetical protein